jgi:hypothetical protein
MLVGRAETEYFELNTRSISIFNIKSLPTGAQTNNQLLACFAVFALRNHYNPKNRLAYVLRSIVAVVQWSDGLVSYKTILSSKLGGFFAGAEPSTQYQN